MQESTTGQASFFLRPEVQGIGFALMATLVWSGNFIVARGLGEFIPPCTLSFCRWLVAFTVVLPFALPGLKREIGHFKTHWRYYTMTSLIGITIFNTLIYQAGHSVPALNMSLIGTTSPLFVMVLARVLFGEPITMARLAGIGAVLVGIVLLISRGDLSSLAALEFHEGDLLMLIASLCFASYTLLVRKKPSGCGQLSYLAATFGIGLVFLLPAALWEGASGRTAEFTGPVIGSLLYVGIGASLFSYWCWGRAIGFIGASRAAVIYYAMPLFCGVEAVLILGESVLWVHYVSGALIVGGLIPATREPKR